MQRKNFEKKSLSQFLNHGWMNWALYSLYLQKLFTFTRLKKPIQLTKPKRLRHIFTHPTYFENTHHVMALKSKPIQRKIYFWKLLKTQFSNVVGIHGPFLASSEPDVDWSDVRSDRYCTSIWPVNGCPRTVQSITVNPVWPNSKFRVKNL